MAGCLVSVWPEKEVKLTLLVVMDSVHQRPSLHQEDTILPFGKCALKEK